MSALELGPGGGGGGARIWHVGFRSKDLGIDCQMRLALHHPLAKSHAMA